ncbi:MAG: RecX family transcriptional regulator [Candidatus Eremiobacteraeota bacterium]|nr:RecX family transcriptional regulator [Candidatus Eremiobacteraeota bacterium]
MAANVVVSALRALAQQRLTESQLWRRLERKGFSDEEIRRAVEVCKADGYIDDCLFAHLYVEQKRKAVGDLRLVGELVKRGITRDAALDALRRSQSTQDQRCDAALQAVLRKNNSINYPAAARALERLGFPSSLIYRKLREHAQKHGPFSSLATEFAGSGSAD